MKTWLDQHRQAAAHAFRQVIYSPVQFIVTLFLLGVATSLPLMLYLIVQGFGEISGTLLDGEEITVFLEKGRGEKTEEGEREQAALDTGSRILSIPGVRDVELISESQALDLFRQQSGFGDLVDGLEENPLPAMLIVYPEQGLDLADISALAERIGSFDGIDMVVYDRVWSQRLQGIMNILRLAVSILVVLMAIGVLLIIANSVRVAVHNRSDEIKILDQVGATGAYIRRPFLYFGSILGVSGAVVALGIVLICVAVVSGPVNDLARLYDSKLRIGWVDWPASLGLVVGCWVLSWGAARVTVGRFVSRMRASARER